MENVQQDPGPGHRFLSGRQAARYLGLSLPQVYALLESGRIGALRIGTTWRVPVTALDRFVESIADGQEQP
jgi:excisionase family DNA binding protein